MACEECFGTIFRRKLGRCTACMWQLALLSAICWPLWYWLYHTTPRTVNSIALLFFCGAFSGLLLLHLLVLTYRRLRGRR
ncbi:MULTISPECIES: DUF3624 domain-containing protein [Shewanella]|uniref:Uncharacterized protein DUF3624 n=1 Tax=Shewanella fodinae TaxID=552357 RepID=A0A4R2F8N2_9GAMM|nr:MULTISPECIES: DUF3624 domain-containing protein [Shewanella]MBO1272996.1 DUF3624 domain-containing protein [Shewanella sp. 4t3-1-2LB]TCN83078.1 uncharacterized protein DUF3624 [Shewanella fodinae]